MHIKCYLCIITRLQKERVLSLHMQYVRVQVAACQGGANSYCWLDLCAAQVGPIRFYNLLTRCSSADWFK